MISEEGGWEGVGEQLLYAAVLAGSGYPGLQMSLKSPQPETVSALLPSMEDAIYTASTQYRLFTFTPKQLSELRHATNKAAAEKITGSIKSARTAAALSSANASPGHLSNGTSDAADDEEVDCPTAEEELKLVAYYCVKCMQLSDHFKFPSNVKATALTFLHRLYLTTSTLTLHPKNILLLILYLATKTENHYTPIESFIATAATAGPVISQEDLLAPEFKVAIGLRWAFQIWHPLRGLEGIFLELNAIDIGRYQSPQGSSVDDAKTRLEVLLRGDAERVGGAHRGARALLTTTALLTDVYFLYTPAQISFAAFWQADHDLATLYIDVKFPPAAESTKLKLLATIKECAGNHLAPAITRDSPNPYPGLLLQLPQNGVATSMEAATERALMKEVTRIDKKLYHVTNRDKKANEKKGAGGENGASNGKGSGKYEGVDEEKRLKKRRLEREKLDKDGDVFGGML